MLQEILVYTGVIILEPEILILEILIAETAAYIAIQVFIELGSDMTEFMKLNLSGI